mgnify:CR=1 FL=1
MRLQPSLIIASMTVALTAPVSASYFSDRNINSDDNFHLDPKQLKNGTQVSKGATSYSSHSSKETLKLNLAPVDSYAAAEKSCRSAGSVYVKDVRRNECSYKYGGYVVYSEYRVHKWNDTLKRCEDSYRYVFKYRACNRN